MNGTTQILTISIPLTQENIGKMGADIRVDDIKVIIKHGFFGFSQGSMTLRRDDTGKLRSIEKEVIHKEEDGKTVEKRIIYLQ